MESMFFKAFSFDQDISAWTSESHQHGLFDFARIKDLRLGPVTPSSDPPNSRYSY
jgi:hypothetical protein